MNLTGYRYGRLTVVNRVVNSKPPRWECACDCGAKVEKSQMDLRSGDTKSCGCLRKDSNANRNHIHGHSCRQNVTTAYKKWKAMRNRVANPDEGKNKCYLGITIDPAWGDFSVFLRDMGEPPKGYSLDRIDNAKGYSKDNCRWVPLCDQARNTTRNVFHNGVHISEAARQAGLPTNVVFDRINKLGWTIERALSTPKRNQAKRA